MAFLTTRIFDKTLESSGWENRQSPREESSGVWNAGDLYEATRLSPQEETQLNVEWRETEGLFRKQISWL